MAFEHTMDEKIMEITAIIDDCLPSEEPSDLYEAMRYLPLLKGKRLRPIMARESCGALGGEMNTAARYGVALEIIHNFTLVHDDIMDEDKTRRGHPTVHEKYDLPTAINAGDGLFARAFEILAGLEIDAGIKVRLVDRVARMSRGIVEGQQMDMNFEGCAIDRTITQEHYLVMIEKKTALMFMNAAAGGAIIAGADEETVRSMEEYGRLIGIGFQICDDILDVKGDHKKLGKRVGSDIVKGKRTIMVIHALENASPADLHKVCNVLGNMDASEESIREAVDVLDRTGSIAYAEKMAWGFADRARGLLASLPENEHSKALDEMIDFMILRDW